MANSFSYQDNSGVDRVVDPSTVDDATWERLYRRDRRYGADRIPLDKRPWRCAERCREAGRDAPMFLRQTRGTREAVHARREDAEWCSEPESDEHKAYKERAARVAQEAGFDADTEVRVPVGSTFLRSDTLIEGANGLRLDLEVQLSRIASNGDRSFRSRAGRAQRAGLTQAWHTDSLEQFGYGGGMWTRTNRLTWEVVAKRPGLALVGGYARLDFWQCTVTAHLPCPVMPARRCGKWHTTTLSGADDALGNITYDDWVRDTAAGLLVPIEHREAHYRRRLWVPAADRDRYEEITGTLSSPPAISPIPPRGGPRTGSEQAATCRTSGPRGGTARATGTGTERPDQNRRYADWSDRKHVSTRPGECRYGCGKTARYLVDDEGFPAHKSCYEDQVLNLPEPPRD